MRVYSKGDGERLVKAARHSIELFLRSARFDSKIIKRSIGEFKDKQGVIVSIFHYPLGEPRGSRGFYRPIGQLNNLVVDAAISAATGDSKYVPVSHYELEHIVIEVSIISALERITGTLEQLRRKIKMGKHGLMIEYGYHTGSLLPNAAIKKKFNIKQFLENTCIGAGLPTNTWKRTDAYLYRFTTQTFREKTPEGAVEELKLD